MIPFLENRLATFGLRHLMPSLAGIAVAASVALGWWRLVDAQRHQVPTAITVEGAFVRAQAEEVAKAALPFLDQTFDSADLNAMRLEIEKLPWVSRARVERRWPHAARIRVWERSAVALWGDKALLDSQAQVFAPPSAEFPIGLPRLNAPVGHEHEILQAFNQFREHLSGSAFEPVAMSLDSRGEWTAQGAQGIEMRLGRKLLDEHVATIRGALVRAVQSDFSRVRYVDLRYDNGFSIGWMQPLQGTVKEGRNG